MCLNACSQITNRPFIESLPSSSFAKEAEYTGPLDTVGQLGDAYIFNVGSLRRANNKLDTLCTAAKVCEENS